MSFLAPTLLAKLPANSYTFQKEFALASSNVFQSVLKMQRCQLKGILIVSFTLVLLYFVHTSAHLPRIIYPPGFLIYAGVQGEEDGQEEGQETN